MPEQVALQGRKAPILISTSAPSEMDHIPTTGATFSNQTGYKVGPPALMMRV